MIISSCISLFLHGFSFLSSFFINYMFNNIIFLECISKRTLFISFSFLLNKYCINTIFIFSKNLCYSLSYFFCWLQFFSFHKKFIKNRRRKTWEIFLLFSLRNRETDLIQKTQKYFFLIFCCHKWKKFPNVHFFDPLQILKINLCILYFLVFFLS